MVFQHVGHEPLGTLNPMLKEAGFRIRYVNYGRHPDTDPTLENYRGLIILGGPMGVYEAAQYPHLKTEMRLIEDALKKDIPVLGICLGAQLIASVLGAKVYKAEDWEFGWCDVKLTPDGQSDAFFKAYKAKEKIFQLHQDTFELPNGATHLAFSDACQAQAFRYGSKVYGLQFHLEVDQAMILRWLARPENKKLVTDSQGKYASEQLESDTDQYITRSLELSESSFSHFIEMFQLRPRPILLDSSHGKPPKAKRK